ncbi:Hypothetical predicted protein [Paramuricea clavata]|uniref:Uncharacterized protein n=1 Tax=Paramuricea clavata TaxID=317549 RepID=A0A7D9LE21_PARCT|nr:Hypothetical predicted protein [Paramuricea clavata]
MEKIERNESTLSSKLAKDISTSYNSEQPDAVNEDETYSKITLGTEPTTSESEQRVLGVNWNFVEDQLVFDLSGIAELAKTCEPTKRNIVRLSAKFYDPLGYMPPITVQFKQMFQELCESKVGWDDEISHSIRVKWEKLEAELLQMKRILLPRCYFYNISERVISFTIHRFCDASKMTYAAVTCLKNKPFRASGSILWHSGSDWLGQTTKKLEDGDEQCVPPEECLAEMKITKPPSLSTLTLSNSSHGLNDIIRCERFGTLKRLLRVTAYVLRFVKAVQHKKDGERSV